MRQAGPSLEEPAGTAEEAEARERRESKSVEGEVPVGAETPSWVEASEAVEGGGGSEAQDQRGRGAGSVTERPSPAQPTNTVLTRVPHKPLTGSPGISFEPVFFDHVSQAGVERETQGLPSGAVPVPQPTSEQLRVPQSGPEDCVPDLQGSVVTDGVMTCGRQCPGPTGARSDSGVPRAPVQRNTSSQDATDSPNKRLKAHVLGEEELLVSTDSRAGDSPQGALPREGAGVGSQEQTQQASKEEAASQEEGWEGHPKP